MPISVVLNAVLFRDTRRATLPVTLRVTYALLGLKSLISSLKSRSKN